MARNPLFDAIDKFATNERVRLAMYMGSKLESGWRRTAVGDNGNSHGYYQINLPFHPSMNVTKARDPEASTRYMRDAYENGVRKVNPSLWNTDPAMAAAWAAFYAERPAKFYGEQRTRKAWGDVKRAYDGGSPAAGTEGAPQSGSVQQTGIGSTFTELGNWFRDTLNKAYFAALIGAGGILLFAGLILIFREYSSAGAMSAKTRDAIISAATLGRK